LTKQIHIKTVLITGAGRGLGRATAEAYHKAGFMVLATDNNPELLADLENKDRYITFTMDVSSEEYIRVCAEKTTKLFGHLDVLISNAGIFDFYPVSEAGSEKLKKIFDVNVLGLTNLTKYFLPLLSKSKGRLIVISSESYKVPSPFQPYSVSKQALESVYKAIKIELSLLGVKSILIRPGAMQTKILEDTIQFNKSDNESQFNDEFSSFVEAVPKYIGKISSPEKVAEIVLQAGIIKKPKSIYHINHNPLVSILSSLPSGLKNRVVKRSLKK
jgi:NAD(P)-dependent dehydrogenase (short-subunit alcohol dehydrogenase family)